MNEHELVIHGLQKFDLDKQEAMIYLELLKKPRTLAQLSTATGINRTTLYRFIDSLIKLGLVGYRVDDRGKYLVAADPSTLESKVVTQEERAKMQRSIFTTLIPHLENVKKGSAADFAIQTYEGTEGLKQMLWHELKAEGDYLAIGFGTLEDMVLDKRWTGKYRQRIIENGYNIREIVNVGTDNKFTKNKLFLTDHYTQRIIPKTILPINHLVSIYNDTVATCHLHQGQRIGLEIVSKTYAQTFRSLFELIWQLAKKPQDNFPL